MHLNKCEPDTELPACGELGNKSFGKTAREGI
jgi:hypothetical protein